MEPITPFWFKQRQCKTEPVDPGNLLKVTGPNLGDAYLRIAQENNLWKASLRLTAEGDDVAGTGAEFASPKAAWDVAFELYRRHILV